MAQNVQNVTIALTLPITCHICLGKVRQPVICVNHHVFCSVCIELWLKNNNQCPACRVPITPENPCKDIIGGTGENECIVSYSVRKHLRKTRLELLHKEYEEEIEALVKETEELKATNLKLEERLNELAVPGATTSPCCCKKADEISNISDKLLVEWSKKLEMVNAANKKVTEDMEKIREQNRKLKNENIEFVRENLRLKNEVDLRSPQKFGRFTVAALQAKVDQYEREISRLKKALERSDQYIEEMEAQVEQLKKPPENNQKEKLECQNAAFMEVYGSTSVQMSAKVNAGEPFPNGNHGTGHTFGSEKAQSIHKNAFVPEMSTFPSTISDGNEEMDLDKSSPWQGRLGSPHSFGSPSSTLPFSTLQLSTPGSKSSSSLNNGCVKKPLTYLRKLVFNDLPKKGEPGKSASTNYGDSLKTGESSAYLIEPKPTLWSFCQNGGQQNEDFKSILQTDRYLQVDREEAKSVAESSVRMLQPISGEDINRTRTSSENSVDAAIHDKISTLHNMSDLESQKIIYNGGVSPASCIASSVSEIEVPSSSSVALPQPTNESTFQSTSPSTQNYSNDSPPAKRKMVNPYSDSPLKSLKH